jgi:hypothetical protein
MDWKAILGTVAPTLATALVGPLGGLAVKAIGDALGMDDATQETVAKALSGATPADLLKLKEADQAFSVKMRELDIDLDRITAGDRDSARKREAAVGDKTARNLAYLIVGAFVGMCCAILFDKAKVDTVLAGTVIGYLSAKAEQVAGYYFGSSSSSKAKDETISRAVK